MLILYFLMNYMKAAEKKSNSQLKRNQVFDKMAEQI